MIQPQTLFTEFDPNLYKQRFMVSVVAVDDCSNCHQLDLDEDLCLEETTGNCCICAGPTCIEHESTQSCFIHAPTARERKTACFVCVTCAKLPREVQEKVHALQRELNQA